MPDLGILPAATATFFDSLPVTSYRLKADFHQIIMNVFGNALKYTQKGSITVRLALDAQDDATAEESERMLEIKVIDTGKGISAEYLRTSLYNRKRYIINGQFKPSNFTQLSAKKTCWQAVLAWVYPSLSRLSLCSVVLLMYKVK